MSLEDNNSNSDNNNNNNNNNMNNRNKYGSNNEGIGNVVSQDSNSKTTDSNGEVPTAHTSEPTEAEKRYHLRVIVIITVCSVFYVVSYLSLNPITVQFFSARIARDKYQIKYNESTNLKCSNVSSVDGDLIDRIQKEASQVIIESGVATGIPACITCFLIGSYSDYLGRKPILMASTTGALIRLLLLMCIIKFEWNIRLYYIGAVIDGICGTNFTYILAATAIVADVTPIAKNRALNFAVIEGVMLPVAACAQIGFGYLIRDESFFLPVVILCGLLVLCLLINIFILPETVQWKRAVAWNPKVHIKKVARFYFLNDSRIKQRLYLFCLGAYVVVSLNNSGRKSVETLFELSDPLCWDPVQIGIYTAIRMVGTAVITVIFLGLMKNRLSLELCGVICALSGIAGFVLYGLSRSSAGLYLAALVGALYLGCIPIPKALLSQLTSATEQGALFSGISVVETVTALVSSTLFTFIYNSTIDTFKGAVFMVIAGITVASVVFLILFRLTRSDSSLADLETLTQPEKKVEEGPATNGRIPLSTGSFNDAYESTHTKL